MADKEQRNAYHREYYQANLEKQRARSREKYHRLKDNWKANLTEEQKLRKAYLNREIQRKWHKNNYVPRPRVKKEKTKVKKTKIEIETEIKIKDEFKPVLSHEKIKPIRTLNQVLNVLKKDTKSRLWHSSFLFWNKKDWQDFIKLENQ